MAIDSTTRKHNRKGGYILPAMMIVALIGILFGLGRLAMFRYQCQLRIDRQHAIDRILATRSAIQWLNAIKYSEAFPTYEGGPEIFTYQGSSGRMYTVKVRAVEPVYKSGWPDTVWSNATPVTSDAEVSYHSPTDNELYRVNLTYGPTTNDVAAIRWDGIPVDETWLNPDLAPYGLRYWFKPAEFEAGEGVNPTNVLVSLYIFSSENGYRQTPYEEGEPWIRVTRNYASRPALEDHGGSLQVAYWDGVATNAIESSDEIGLDTVQYGAGVQLFLNRATPFQWVRDVGIRMEDFVDFDAGITSSFQSIQLYVEVKPISDFADANPAIARFEHVTVSQPYEFEIELSWQHGQTVRSEVATVVYARPLAAQAGWRMVTYDTHGTEAR